jgi:hypothetical protein
VVIGWSRRGVLAADGESVKDQLDDLRTQWIELSDEIAPNISPIGEAPGSIRGKPVDPVEANDADLHRRPVPPPAPPVRSDRRREGHHPDRPHLIVIIWPVPHDSAEYRDLGSRWVRVYRVIDTVMARRVGWWIPRPVAG